MKRFKRWLARVLGVERQWDAWEQVKAERDDELDGILYPLADPEPTQTAFDSEHQARAVCMSRTFMTGEPHWAHVDDDGVWHVEPVTAQAK